MASRCDHPNTSQRGRSVSINTRPGDKSELAEQTLLAGIQLGIREVEGSANGQILRVHEGQPVPCRCELGCQTFRGPGGMVAQLAGEHPNGQREISAQPGYLAD